MKNKIFLKFIVTIACIGTFLHGYAQQTHEILLKVDGNNPSTKKGWSLTSGANTTVLGNGSFDDFSIVADVGDTVTWKGITPVNKSMSVHILGVDYLGGPRIFSANSLLGKDITKATIIRGGKELYTYQLKFRVGESSKIYVIKSKIKIRM